MCIKCWLNTRIACNFITLEIIKLLLFDSDEKIAGYQMCCHTHVYSIIQQLKEGSKKLFGCVLFACSHTDDWFWGKKEHSLFWRLPVGIIHSTVNETCLPQEKKGTINSGLPSEIWICILMFPCPKSERIDLAKQLLLCYNSGESQAVYLAAGLWGEVVIILGRNMHWKAKSLHIAQQGKHSTIRGHHCCVQREAESICCSWKIACLLFPVGCGGQVLPVWCPSFCLFQWLWQNFQQTLPEYYLGSCLGAGKRLLNQNSFY